MSSFKQFVVNASNRLHRRSGNIEQVALFNSDGSPYSGGIITNSFLVAFNAELIEYPAGDPIVWASPDPEADGGNTVGDDLSIVGGNLHILTDGLYAITVDWSIWVGTGVIIGGDLQVAIGYNAGTDVPSDDYLYWSNTITSMTIPSVNDDEHAIRGVLHWPLMRLLEGNILEFSIGSVGDLGVGANTAIDSSTLLARRLA